MDNVEPVCMPYKLLSEITDGFSDRRIVGRGTFGVVYKGEDKDAQVIAVKVLKFFEGVNDDDFHREFNNLAKLRHENIVQLLGFCNETENVVVEHNGKPVCAEKVYRALCFEYMQNGSLHKHLHDVDQGFGWNRRYRIIKGICEGLKYLHMRSRPINHLDLKPDNILLDNNMVPKIADFGLSRLLGEETTKATISAVGTRGYMPPEYVNYQIISKEFDIFSLGVIIIKIMMGSAGYSLISDMEPDKFVEHVCNKWRERLQVIGWQYTLLIQQVKKCIEIALKCIETDKNCRPTVGSIIEQLNETERQTNDSTSWMEESDDRESVPPKRNSPTRRYQGNQRTLERSLKRKIPSASDNQNPDGGPSRRDGDQNSDGGTSRRVDNENLDGSATNTNHTTLCSSRISQREINFDEVRYDQADRRRISNYIRVGEKKGDSSIQSSLKDNSQIPSAFPREPKLEFLKEITNDFSSEREVGHGGFGVVYTGILQSGQLVAVKKLVRTSGVHDRRFQNEAGKLQILEHRNIVRLLGSCYQVEKKLVERNGKHFLSDVPQKFLCCEYLSNGSLDKYIYDESSVLDWPMRFKIILGICNGLHFLHEERSEAIVHLNLKPSNIMLDDNMVPKIADFGLSRLFGEEQSRILTKNVVGWIGYIAPEYHYRGEISVKSDIFSLGVLILELVTGLKRDLEIQDISSKLLIDNVSKNWNKRSHIELKYPSLEEQHLLQVKKCIEVGLNCVEIDPKKRPTIGSIIGKLEASSSTAATLLQPGEGAVKEVNITNQMSVQDPLMINQVEAAQNHLQANLNQTATSDNPAVPIRVNNSNISLSESRAVIEQREAITKFLTDGLRTLMANRGDTSSRVLESLGTPNSLIKIDLAALGITSLTIAVNVPEQNNMDGPPHGSKLLLQEPVVAQPESYSLVPPAVPLKKPEQITKVYYRRKFKSEGGSYEKQTVLVDHASENIGNIFGSMLADNSDKGKNSMSQKKKSSTLTPPTTKKLRRSPRFIEKLDGHKLSFPLEKHLAETRTKARRSSPRLI